MKSFKQLKVFLLFVISNQIVIGQPLLRDKIFPGEKLIYNVHYGVLDAGRLEVETMSNLEMIDSIPCFKVEINGYTKGAGKIAGKIEDKWVSYIDTNTLLPYRFYRDIYENGYTKEELCVFDRENRHTVVTVREKENAAHVKTYPILSHTHDMVSSYFLIRQVKFKKLTEGDTLRLPVFFENEQFEIKVLYLGKDKLRTKFGKEKVAIISPVLPKNSIFRGKNPVKAYIMWHHKQIPVKVKAKLVVGSVELDLINYNGQKKGKIK